NFLLNAVFVNVEIFLPQISDVAAVSIHYHRRYGDETGANPNDTPFIDLVRTSVAWLFLIPGIDAGRAEYWPCPRLLRRLRKPYYRSPHYKTSQENSRG